MKLSAQNILQGTIGNIAKGAVNAEITMTIDNDTQIISIITNSALERLELAEGKQAMAIIKASSVLLCQELHDARLSTRNVMPGIIANIIKGAVNAEVDVAVSEGTTITAIITNGSADSMKLKQGDHACVAFKASSVLIGME